ncbi:hypothetical protein BH20ACI2_BH20ACI2_05150 [soil metagenome]
MAWNLKNIPHLTGYTVEWAGPDNYYLSRRNRIYHSVDLKPPFREIGRIEAPLWRRGASRIRLGQRLLRFMVYNVIPLACGDVFVTFDKQVGLIRNGRYVELEGLVRPCRVLRAGCAVDAVGDVYFGEYLANDERGPMRIYRYSAVGRLLEIAHTFPAGSIKHIHGLYFDEHTNSVYCLTGDAESECRILRSSDGFTSIEVVGEGDESWRAVSMLFDEEHIFYGTDAEFRDNEIFRIDRETGRRERLGEVSGTVFYSKSLGSDLIFTTTAENAPIQRENVAALWTVSRDGQVCEIVKFEKDIWHGGLFMFGTIHLPYDNQFEDRLYFGLVGVKGDCSTYCIYRT